MTGLQGGLVGLVSLCLCGWSLTSPRWSASSSLRLRFCATSCAAHVFVSAVSPDLSPGVQHSACAR